MKLSIISILIIFCWSCQDDTTKKVNKQVKDTLAFVSRPLPLDSLKIFYFSKSKKAFDSLDIKLTKTVVSRQGINFKKVFEEIAKRDTSAYFYYQQYAYELGLNGHPYEALEYLNAGHKYARNIGRYYFDKAITFAYVEPLGKRDSVYYCFEKAISLDSLNAYYYAVRAQFYNEENVNDKALRDIQHAIALDAKDTSYVNFRGVLKVVFRDYKGAVNDLRHVAALNLNSYQLYVARAVALIHTNKPQQALLDLNTVMRIAPNTNLIYPIRANAKEMLGDHDGAIQDIKIGALKGNPECIEFQKKIDEYNENNRQS